MNSFSKGGVYGTRKTGQAFHGTADRHVAPLEAGESLHEIGRTQARGVLKKELIQHLRSKRLIRRSRHARADGQSRGQIVDAISIRERPAEVEDRAIAGHWEGDLLSGSRNSHIATLVERHSGFTMLIKVPSKDTATVVAALSKHVRKLPRPCGAR
jgi:IS30 family transposase